MIETNANETTNTSKVKTGIKKNGLIRDESIPNKSLDKCKTRICIR